MNNQKHTVVGIFVLLATAFMIAVWLWFSVKSHQSYNTYVAVFHEAVDGVTNDSIIKYNGVEVGRVKQIKLDGNNPHNIYVYLNIMQGIKIQSDTYATMKPQGITGLSYIELALPTDSSNNQFIKPSDQPPYPEIQTRTSLLSSLVGQAQSLTTNINGVSSQLKLALNDKNLEHFSNILANLDKVSASIAKHSNEISQSISSVSDILKNVKTNTADLKDTVKNISELTNSLSHTAQNVNTLLDDMKDTTLQNINTIFLPNLNQAVLNMNQSSMQLDQLLNTLNQNPAILIRGKTPHQKGPGE